MPRQLGQQVIGQFGDVFRVLSQRRNAHRYDVESIVEIFPEGAIPHAFPEPRRGSKWTGDTSVPQYDRQLVDSNPSGESVAPRMRKPNLPRTMYAHRGRLREDLLLCC
jgi:hypothetical protein